MRMLLWEKHRNAERQQGKSGRIMLQPLKEGWKLLQLLKEGLIMLHPLKEGRIMLQPLRDMLHPFEDWPDYAPSAVEGRIL